MSSPAPLRDLHRALFLPTHFPRLATLGPCFPPLVTLPRLFSAGTAVSRRLTLEDAKWCARKPSPTPAPAHVFCTFVATVDGGTPGPAAVSIPVAILAALAALTLWPLLSRAGTSSCERDRRGGPTAPPPPRQRPRDRRAPGVPAPHQLPPSLPSLTSPSPSISNPRIPPSVPFAPLITPPTPDPDATAPAAARRLFLWCQLVHDYSELRKINNSYFAFVLRSWWSLPGDRRSGGPAGGHLGGNKNTHISEYLLRHPAVRALGHMVL